MFNSSILSALCLSAAAGLETGKETAPPLSLTADQREQLLTYALPQSQVGLDTLAKMTDNGVETNEGRIARVHKAARQAIGMIKAKSLAWKLYKDASKDEASDMKKKLLKKADKDGNGGGKGMGKADIEASHNRILDDVETSLSDLLDDIKVLRRIQGIKGVNLPAEYAQAMNGKADVESLIAHMTGVRVASTGDFEKAINLI